eukprot:3697486-Pyramimonas_sp.AAC.1
MFARPRSGCAASSGRGRGRAWRRASSPRMSVAPGSPDPFGAVRKSLEGRGTGTVTRMARDPVDAELGHSPRRPWPDREE